MANFDTVRISSTAIYSKKEQSDKKNKTDGDDQEKKARDKRKAKRHKHSAAAEPLFDFPGVTRIIMTEETQKFLKCLVGEGVTAEKPWKFIRKDFIEELIEADENSEFLPHKEMVLAYPREEMLLGYIPDESSNYDEFYFCMIPEAEDRINEIVYRIEKMRKKRLQNTLKRRIRTWNTLGSEEEVNDFVYRNNRPLLQVELECAYPIMSSKVQLHMRKVKDAPDGYAELLVPAKYVMTNVIKRRIDNGTQVAPSLVESYAQTICTHPKNQWTQYEYEYEKILHVTQDFLKNYFKFCEENMEDIYNNLTVNKFMNLYTDDYADLVKDEMYTQTPTKTVSPEILSLADIKRCRNKLITSISWHPMWTGTVAIAYWYTTPYSYHRCCSNRDIINEHVYEQHIVLIWSFKDILYPKLILEAPIDVRCISFCPHNEYILIGGCSSGQVVVWDIRNKLSKVEEEAVLTTEQQTYRNVMYSLMKWMINTRDFAVIRPTAVSDILWSHQYYISSIAWIHPLYEISKTGKLEEVADLEQGDMSKISLQLATSSCDGTILFWDLLAKPIFTAGDYKPHRKLRRLKKRPSALTVDVSSFRILHRNLRPIYKINVKMHADFPHAFIPITSFFLFTKGLVYEKISDDPNPVNNFSDRIKFKPIIEKPAKPPKQKFAVGTVNGYVLICAWDGYDYISGDIVSSEDARIISKGLYHDGPVIRVEVNDFIEDLFLSVGGKVMCVWKEKLNDQPLLWRRSRNYYTFGHWSHTRPSFLRLSRSDGNCELWKFLVNTHKFDSDISYSGKSILSVMPQLRTVDKIYVGISDDKGYFRVIVVEMSHKDSNKESEVLDRLCTKNVNRKLNFYKWQHDWTRVHASWIKQQKEEALAELKRREDEKELEKQKAEELAERMAIEEAKKASAKLKIPLGKYSQWAHEQWIIKEEERMANIILSKKSLNKETLIKQEAPIKQLEMEEYKRKQKQKDRLRNADKIFKNTVTMLFPDLLHKEEFLKLDPYKCYVRKEIIEDNFRVFANIVDEATDFVMNNQFEYRIQWKETLKLCRARKDLMDARIGKCTHKFRLEQERSASGPRTGKSFGIQSIRDQSDQSISIYERTELTNLELDESDERIRMSSVTF